MNKEIQQEAERRYQMFDEGEKPSWVDLPSLNYRAHENQQAFIEGATFAQQKQDERMIEFAQWVIEKHMPCIIPGSNKMFYANNPLSLEGLLTIFKTEKGY